MNLSRRVYWLGMERLGPSPMNPFVGGLDYKSGDVLL